MKIREHFIFNGRVQGVGFRYRAYHLAHYLGLTGWVENMEDDRVEMELQGEADVIDEMLDGLDRLHFVEIDHVDRTKIPLEEEISFMIR